MDICKSENGFTLHKNDNKFELTWDEFWQLSKKSDHVDAENEIEEYLDGIDQDAFDLNSKYTVDMIFKDANIMHEIINKLIKIRIDNETTDDIHEALTYVCGANCLTF